MTGRRAKTPNNGHHLFPEWAVSITSCQIGWVTCVPRKDLHCWNWCKAPKLVVWDCNGRLRCDSYKSIQRAKKELQPTLFTFPSGSLSLFIRTFGYRDLAIPHQHAGSSSFIVICHLSSQDRSQLNVKISLLHAKIAMTGLVLVYSETLTVENAGPTYLLIIIPTLLTSPVFNSPASFFSFPL